MDIVKAGYLYKQSSFLRRWEKMWFVLYTNGKLLCFENKDSSRSNEIIDMPIACIGIKSGVECDFEPCSESNAESRILLTCAEKEYRLCAESADDRMAWIMMLEEAKRLRPPPRIYQQAPPRPGSAPPTGPYQAMGQPRYYYPQQPMVYGGEGSYVLPQSVVYHPNGTTTVVVGREGVPYCYHHHRHCCDSCNGTGAALGLGAGLAAGTLLWTPFMWAPFFWC